jgi:hypothetical protein
MLEKARLVKIAAMGVLAFAASCSASSSSDSPGTSPDGGSQLPESDASESDASGAGDAGSLEGSASESSGAPAPDYASGSRIHAVVFVSGSAKLFKTWHDTQLDTDCTFGLAEDGKVRCVPTAALTIRYSDAGCTKPLLNASPCDGTKFLGIGSSIMCPTQAPAIYRLGPKLPAPAMVYEMKDRTCTAAMPSSDGDFYEGITKIDAATLVEGATTREKRSSTFSVDVVRGADGSIETRGIIQTPAGYKCSLDLPAQDIPKRCWPENVAYKEVFFSDANCQASVAFKASYGTYCHEDPVAVQVETAPTTPMCFTHQDPTFTEVGAKFAGMIYRKDSAQGMCMVDPPVDPASTFWAPGDAIPASSFAELATKDEGTGPVQMRAIFASTGERLRSGVFVDTMRQAPCRPVHAGDGQLRCVPFVDPVSVAYAFDDDQCKQPVVPLLAGCMPSATAENFESIPKSCDGKLHIYTVGQRSSPTVLYGNDGTTCQMSLVAVPGTDYYETSGEIPASTFPAITTTVE